MALKKYAAGFIAGSIFCFSAMAENAICNYSGTQTEMNICSRQDYMNADQELNRLYQKKLKAFTEPANKIRFRNAQKVWVQFRDASCLYEIGPREDSGTIWPLLQNSCLGAMTVERARTLKKYAACTEDGCPQ